MRKKDSTAEYTEDFVAISLQAYLSIVGFSHQNYWIDTISRRLENSEGYDARLNLRMLTFYMQFKRPEYLGSKAKPYKQRESNKRKIAPSCLQFALHRPKEKNDQHNLLFKLSQTKSAAYVCPLILDKEEYKASMNTGLWEALPIWLGLRQPHSMRPFDIFDMLHRKSVSVQDIPVFKNHISIRPHARADDLPHRYSFTRFGEDVCFHSPEGLPANGTLLSEWLASIYNDSRDLDKTFPIVGSKERLNALMLSLGNDVENFEIPSEANELDAWIAFGDFLEASFNIRQYAFIRRQN